jgi:hypothetical protein
VKITCSDLIHASRANADGGKPLRVGSYTLFRPRHVWMFPLGGGASVVHRMDEGIIVWRSAETFLLGARTSCGRVYGVRESYHEVPDEADLCDTCLLGADFVIWTVYRCFDGDGRLIYLGSTGRLDRRIVAHRTQSRWWWRVESCTFEVLPNELAARAAERRAIEAERPLYNSAHSSRSPSLRR